MGNSKVISATKWSFATQIISKLIAPLTTLILAHLLSPDTFGVIALITMVTSFADLFSDAGFQKYLIQHEFNDAKAYKLSSNVAFWTNLALSLIIIFIIFIFRDSLAVFLGNPEIGSGLSVASLSILLTSAISVQTAVYQRKFDFKSLFYSRIISACFVFIVSVPLAWFGFDYWSMIIGTLISNLFLAIWLTAKSDWKPSFQYSFSALSSMVSFSIWTVFEAFSVWITNWVGAFIIGTLMSTYYVGLYNTSISLTTSVVGVVTGAVNPVIFASLCRLQNDRNKFDSAIYYYQKALGFFVIPIAAGLFVYSDIIIEILLGEAWVEASLFFGLYALASAIAVVFGHISSCAYRAMGKPRYSLYAQLGFLLFILPALIYSSNVDFATLSWLVPLSRIFGCLIPHGIILAVLFKLSPLKMISNLKLIYLVTAIVAVISLLVREAYSFDLFGLLVLGMFSCLFYILLCLFIKPLRVFFLDILHKFGIKGIFAKRS